MLTALGKRPLKKKFKSPNTYHAWHGRQLLFPGRLEGRGICRFFYTHHLTEASHCLLFALKEVSSVSFTEPETEVWGSNWPRCSEAMASSPPSISTQRSVLLESSPAQPSLTPGSLRPPALCPRPSPAPPHIPGFLLLTHTAP